MSYSGSKFRIVSNGSHHHVEVWEENWEGRWRWRRVAPRLLLCDEGGGHRKEFAPSAAPTQLEPGLGGLTKTGAPGSGSIGLQ